MSKLGSVASGLNSELLLLNHEIKIFRKALLPLHEKEFPRLEVIFYSQHLIGLGKIRGKGVKYIACRLSYFVSSKIVKMPSPTTQTVLVRN